MTGPINTTFLLMLTLIAIAALVAGTVLAVTGYSSAGPFSISAACVGVLGTLAAEGRITKEQVWPPMPPYDQAGDES